MPAIQSIKEGISQAATEDDPDGSIENEVIDLVALNRRPGSFGLAYRQPPGKYQAGQVGQPIPVNLEGAEADGDRIDIRIGNHSGRPWLDRI